MPLAISDASLSLLLQLASPLAIDDRGKFLTDVADLLKREPELGDGAVARAARAAQSRYLRPATTADLRAVPKYELKLRNGSGRGNGGQAA